MLRSPALGIALVWWILLGALALISVTIIVYEIASVIKSGNEVKKADITKAMIDAMPTDTPVQVKAKSDAAAKAVDALAEQAAKGDTSIFGDIGKTVGEVTKGALIIGLIVLAIMAFGTAKEYLPKPKGA